MHLSGSEDVCLSHPKNVIVYMQDPYPERSIESLDLMEAMMLWLLRWGKKQNVAAEQKLVAQRQQAATEKQAALAAAAGASDTHPDAPTGINGFANAEAQSQVCMYDVSCTTQQSVACKWRGSVCDRSDCCSNLTDAQGK